MLVALEVPMASEVLAALEGLGVLVEPEFLVV